MPLLALGPDLLHMTRMPRSPGYALAIDHLVLPTRSLASARARLGTLGFTVAPEGTHPFGTRNACVYFADGTFLEPLAHGDAAPRKEAEREGNVFVIRDRQFRESMGPEGLSALVFATGDASADHARFAAAGISAGKELFFSRLFVDVDGKSDTASFRLAFAAGANALPFFFSCERVNAPSVDRTRLESHENGAVRIVAISMAARNPASTAALVAEISGARIVEEPGGVRLDLPNGVVRIIAAEPAEKASSDFAFTGVTFAVRDLAATRGLFSARGIHYQDVDGKLIAPAVSGQGAEFTFEERA